MAWMEEVKTSDFPFLAQFARALRRDLQAVKLAITTPWSNGLIEGHINRLNAIKRQMYSRAKLEFLKARVLPWDDLRRTELAPKVRKIAKSVREPSKGKTTPHSCKMLL